MRNFNLVDVVPADQGGDYSTIYDYYFSKYAKKYAVPFAMIKAHAIVESSLNANAFRDESDTGSNREGWASRGLMQILWWPKSERFKKYGHPDSTLGASGELMFDPDTNVDIGACLIRDNLRACNGNVRDAMNMYNAGVKESVRKAPNGYVDKVFGIYDQLTNGKASQ